MEGAGATLSPQITSSLQNSIQCKRASGMASEDLITMKNHR